MILAGFHPIGRVPGVIAPVLLGLLAFGPAALAQTTEMAAATTVKLKLKATDRNAAAVATNHLAHISPPNGNPAGRVSGSAIHLPAGQTPGSFEEAAPTAPAAEPQAADALPSVPAPGFYPGDVSNPKNGPVVTVAESNPIYVNAPASHWGFPAAFLRRLGRSDFIHVLDQYTGITDDDRYTVGTGGVLSYPVYAPLDDNDILQIVHAGAQALGAGYGHIYHVFLPRGTDVCFSGTSECYSPDNPSTFAFCAYHASVDFNDLGHVLYTVEPFQNVKGCSVAQPSPNGALVDSMADSLSHELFETISDPDGNAWWDRGALVLYGEEIGDTCANPSFSNPAITVAGTEYAIQSEYSNTYHACAYVP